MDMDIPKGGKKDYFRKFNDDYKESRQEKQM